MHGAFTFDDGAVRVFFRFFQMTLHHRYAFDASAILSREKFKDFARLTFVGAGDDNDFLAPFDVKFLHFKEPPVRAR